MTRAEALTKLLSLGPCTDPELRDICGWPAETLLDVLLELVQCGRITWSNVGRGMRVWQLTR